MSVLPQVICPGCRQAMSLTSNAIMAHQLFCAPPTSTDWIQFMGGTITRPVKLWVGNSMEAMATGRVIGRYE